MFIIITNKLHVGGIALYPFIFLNRKVVSERLPRLLNHERIHIRQQLELLVIPFYILYLINYLINLLVYRSHKKAYRNIAFEREAFAKEGDEHYLKKRKLFAFVRYFSGRTR
jgi:hypothetical protein